MLGEAFNKMTRKISAISYKNEYAMVHVFSVEK